MIFKDLWSLSLKDEFFEEKHKNIFDWQKKNQLKNMRKSYTNRDIIFVDKFMSQRV